MAGHGNGGNDGTCTSGPKGAGIVPPLTGPAKIWGTHGAITHEAPSLSLLYAFFSQHFFSFLFSSLSVCWLYDMKENKRVWSRVLSWPAIRIQTERFKHHWRLYPLGRPRTARIVLVATLLIGSTWLVVAGGRSLWNELHHRQGSRNVSCKSFYTYQSRSELDFRESRFPSVEERVQIYMGQWYLPPTESVTCEAKVRYMPLEKKPFSTSSSPNVLIRELSWSNASITGRTGPNDHLTWNRFFQVDSSINPARMFVLHPSTMIPCAKARSAEESKMFMYCKDTNSTISVNLLDEAKSIPILLQYGDASETKAPAVWKHSLGQQQQQNKLEILWSHPVVPHLKKFRKSWSRAKFSQLILPENCPGARVLEQPSKTVHQIVQPIVWKLNVKRHYSKLQEVPCNDRPWNEKKSMAVFRGKLNGFVNKQVQASAGMNDRGTCISIDRCRLVYNTRGSLRIDAKLTSVGGRIAENLDGYNITGSSLSMAELLEYKALIFVEGNDVSSGLKWALMSNSIVMMPIPRFTSWAMEERLEPWIHYVPLSDDLADAEARLTWILKHEQEAARIVRRATLWILDLVFHPNVEQEEKQVFTEILRRYARHFTLDEKLQELIR